MSQNAEGRPQQQEGGPRTTPIADVASSVPDVRRAEPLRARRVHKHTVARHVWATCPTCDRTWSHDGATLDAVDHTDQSGHRTFVHYGTAQSYEPSPWRRAELERRDARW